MKQKVIIKIDAKEKYIADLLIIAGYKEHYRGNGWVRNLGDKRRFHVCPIGDAIELHMDVTINQKHVVAGSNWKKALSDERNYLKHVYRSLDPDCKQVPAAKLKVRAVKEVAPNLAQIQKEISQHNKKPPTMYERMRSFFRDKIKLGRFFEN